MKINKGELSSFIVLLLLIGSGYIMQQHQQTEPTFEPIVLHSQVSSPAKIDNQVTEKPNLINPNEATLGELVKLPGFGPELSSRIIDYRENNPPFVSPYDLLKVPGIGEKRLNKILPYLKIETKETLSTSKPKKSINNEKSDKYTSLPEPECIDLNKADELELQKLPGVGESISRRIIEYRQSQGAFTSLEDLLHIKGIGEKKLEKIKAQVCLE